MLSHLGIAAIEFAVLLIQRGVSAGEAAQIKNGSIFVQSEHHRFCIRFASAKPNQQLLRSILIDVIEIVFPMCDTLLIVVFRDICKSAIQLNRIHIRHIVLGLRHFRGGRLGGCLLGGGFLCSSGFRHCLCGICLGGAAVQLVVQADHVRLELLLADFMGCLIRLTKHPIGHGNRVVVFLLELDGQTGIVLLVRSEKFHHIVGIVSPVIFAVICCNQVAHCDVRQKFKIRILNCFNGTVALFVPVAFQPCNNRNRSSCHNNNYHNDNDCRLVIALRDHLSAASRFTGWYSDLRCSRAGADAILRRCGIVCVTDGRSAVVTELRRVVYLSSAICAKHCNAPFRFSRF